MPLTFSIVTFNTREASAIDALFDQIIAFGGWRRRGPNRVYTGKGAFTLVLRHIPLNSQGNVVAASSLAQLFDESNVDEDFTIFYGCAGVVEPRWVDHVFLVGEVTYASLGTVSMTAPSGPSEQVTLKNKWICHTSPKEVEPLPAVSFPSVLGHGAINLSRITGIEVAHVMATDKVVKVGASASAPGPLLHGSAHKSYSKQDWTYGDALAHVKDNCGGRPLLVEMESFGIGMLAKALKVEDRAVVIRVTTDSLVDHLGSDPQQAAMLLKFNRAVLAVIIPITKQAWGLKP